MNVYERPFKSAQHCIYELRNAPMVLYNVMGAYMMIWYGTVSVVVAVVTAAAGTDDLNNDNDNSAYNTDDDSRNWKPVWRPAKLNRCRSLLRVWRRRLVLCLHC